MARENRQRKALIIEDEFIVAEGNLSLLDETDITAVGPASNVEQALYLFLTESPDFLISDIRLHKGTEGLTAVNLINKNAGHPMPVIFTTGFKWLQLEQIISLIPYSTLVRKPFVESDLVEAIHAVMDAQLNH